MRIYTLLSLVFFFLVSSFSFAQELNLPRKSPKAGIFHTIGYTEVAIQYGSPAVQGREIWGGLAPYGELWRAGADEATIMEFSMDVELEGQPLAAGKYAFFLIPQKEGKWTAVFNKTWDQWGAYNYDPGQDALRVEVDAQFSKQANQEHLQYEIIGQNVENGYILLSWEKLRLYLRVKVNTMQKAVLEITTALAAAPEAQKWRINAQAADFLLWVGQPGPALQYIEESIRQNEASWNYWVKARILAAREDYASALVAAESAKKRAGANPEDHFYEDQKREIEKLVKEWKGKE
ncbi:MAG: DUF2911 domain-containing protein [Lewinellaceae bacterium]|nr:DUF2911 domain-containing protein [Phaeodactylibacter sp.]MCB0614687.1 DUF2911 domain-containing protein [Phaeodactylibacter sp.]MCB9346690.1 DUF2911 domain-containing protein [Lewinellaceae bacterium]